GGYFGGAATARVGCWTWRTGCEPCDRPVDRSSGICENGGGDPGNPAREPEIRSDSCPARRNGTRSRGTGPLTALAGLDPYGDDCRRRSQDLGNQRAKENRTWLRLWSLKLRRHAAILNFLS